MHPHERLVHDMQPAFGQQAVNIGYPAIGGVFHRQHGNVGVFVAHCRDHILETAAGQRLHIRTRITAGFMAVGAGFSLKGNALGHGSYSKNPVPGRFVAASIPCHRQGEDVDTRPTVTLRDSRAMDTMTSTKILGAFCGAFLIFLLGKWAAEVIYATGGEEQAYVIDTGDDGAAEEVTEGPSLEELIAAADLGKGEKVWGKCRACHKVEDGANGTGPHLYGVVGRPTGAVDGFGYSGAMQAVTPEWNVAALDAFLTNPKGYAPGTKMSFSGLKKPADRANLIAWLDSLDD